MTCFPRFSYLTVTVVVLITILSDNDVSGWRIVDDTKDLTLTYSEKRALDKLKVQVWDILPEDFMKSDFYLIRWIRTANLDVPTAENLLIKNIQWRKKNNISNIVNEDWSEFKYDYRASFGARDKEGRPVGTLDLGEFDLLGAVISGRKPRLQRYLAYVSERAIRELFKAQQESTKSITRGIILVDGDGGSIRNLCPACIAILFQWIREMEMYYPSFIREIILINAPSITNIALKALRPAMSQETQDIIHIFDMNRKVWMEYLDKIIDRNQRTPSKCKIQG